MGSSPFLSALTRKMAAKLVEMAREAGQVARRHLALRGPHRVCHGRHALGEGAVGLIGDAEMRKLNAQVRHKDYPTDVLSFPVESDLPGAARLLGDVSISVDKARRQAKERGRSLEEEIVTLLIHGVVHLLGYDHERSAQDARIMARLEKKIYRALCDQGRLRL